MDFPDYFNLTPGERMARAGTSAVRPFHPDWANQQLTAIVDAVRLNPWFVETYGRNVDVSVNASKDGHTLLLAFHRLP